LFFEHFSLGALASRRQIAVARMKLAGGTPALPGCAKPNCTENAELQVARENFTLVA
jgi:hypothetical protein